MKNLFKVFSSASLALSITLSANAQARSPMAPITSIYLGGANSPAHCQLLASAYGYNSALYGAGYDFQGIYYPYFNACFGVLNTGGGTPIPPVESNKYGWFSVWIGGNYSVSECKSILTNEVAGLTCLEDDRWGKLECYASHSSKTR